MDTTPSSNAQAPDDVKDRRGAPRVRVIQKGNIRFLDSGAGVTCVILDRSETGARLRPTDVLSCPDRFQLHSPGVPPRPCEVVWRDGQKIGVQFLDRAP